MNIIELSNLIKWSKKQIIEPQIIQKYSALHTVLQVNAQPNQSKQPFEQQKNDLLSALLNISTDDLTKDQIKFLETTKILHHIGRAGNNNIEDILYKNVIDVATSAQKIQLIIQDLNSGINRFNQIENGLQDCLIEDTTEYTNQVLMRISFKGNAKIENLSELKNWGNSWYDIGRGITMAHNSAPEDIKIIGAGKGSIIIELLIGKYIAKSVTEIILGALQVAERVLEIMKKAEELKAMKLNNQKIAQELLETAEEEKKSGIEKIKNDMVSILDIKEKSEGDKVKALETSIKNLVNFIEKGGDVDLIIPENSESDEGDLSNTELRVAFQEVRQLEKKIDLLEFQLNKQDVNSEISDPE